MSPRPKTVTDESIMAAVHRTMTRLGPMKFTLAAVGREAGVSAATLVQRFGSKRQLLLAVSTANVDYVDQCFAALADQHASPLAALIAAATDMARHTTSAEELANSLAFLQIDVTDPDFRRPMIEVSQKLFKGYRTLIERAVAAGEMRSNDAEALARAISALTAGSLINWGAFRKGTAEQWVRADLDALLGPYLTGPSTRRGAARSGQVQSTRRGSARSRRARH